MSTEENGLLLVIADTIAGYLELHPDAADSAEGIQHWWLPPAGCAGSLDAVESALRLLELEGVVVKTEIGGTVIYRRSTQGGKARRSPAQRQP